MQTLETIYESLGTSLTDKGYKVTLIPNEATEGYKKICIKHSDSGIFEVNIYGDGWNKKGKGSLSVEGSVHYSLRDPNKPDVNVSDKFDILRYATSETREKYNLHGYDRYEYHKLHKDFKADKNPKLIQKDVIPTCEAWLEICKEAEPKIRNEHARDLNTAKLMTILRRAAGHRDGYVYVLPERDANYKLKGTDTEIKIDVFGRITVTKPITEEEFLALVK